MSNEIKHKGEIIEVTDGHVMVRIVQTSACASCKIAGHCSASEMKEKIVDVYMPTLGTDMHVGDEVVVCTSSRAVNKALLFAFIFPFAVLMVSLFGMISLGFDDILAAVSSLGFVLLYYLVLYLFKNKVSRGVEFVIEGKS